MWYKRNKRRWGDGRLQKPPDKVEMMIINLGRLYQIRCISIVATEGGAYQSRCEPKLN